ncbi:hypothetical protein Agub_g15270 [Astrephomene gubernaculifera]|uniref:CRAL-TRIO domain-containing protein n=1 Tax=Astrephomene gubernaculifera TaxID=47775 RepID=A0AAD3HTW4_9CHLO|nr:hypothetical protein Agub_g15270 [Astrephomene gubernaculifera]
MSWFSHSPTPHRVQTEEEAFWYLNLTSEQQSAYEKFHEHLQQTSALLAGHDDRYTLLRFLKARQWDVGRATTMYQNMVNWRKEHRTDEVYQTFTFEEEEAVVAHYPHFYHKCDRYGRPVYIELLGQADPARILEATSLERLLDYHICEWERLKRQILPACSQLAGRPIITKCVILDLKGVSMKSFGTAAQRILRAVAAIDQDYYCESLGQMFIINTPTVFRLIWAVVNPLLEDRTRRKIAILGSDYLPTLTQLVAEEDLPACLGGKSERQDMRTNIGPWTEVVLQASSSGGAAVAPAAGRQCGDSAQGGEGRCGAAVEPQAVAVAADAAAAAPAEPAPLPPANG